MARSERKTDIFGNEYIQHYDDAGNEIGRSEQKTGLFGDAYTEHRDEGGAEVGRSEDRTGLFGDEYTEHRDESGREVGRSENRTGLFGDEYVEHRDEHGRRIGRSEHKTGVFGDEYTEHEAEPDVRRGPPIFTRPFPRPGGNDDSGFAAFFWGMILFSIAIIVWVIVALWKYRHLRAAFFLYLAIGLQLGLFMSLMASQVHIIIAAVVAAALSAVLYRFCFSAWRWRAADGPRAAAWQISGTMAALTLAANLALAVTQPDFVTQNRLAFQRNQSVGAQAPTNTPASTRNSFSAPPIDSYEESPEFPAADVASAPAAAPVDAAVLEEQVRARLTAAAQRLQSDGFELVGRTVISRLDAGAETSLPLALNSRTQYRLIGACDAECSDLDLRVRDQNGRLIGADTGANHSPSVALQPTSSGSFQLGVRMERCPFSACVFGVALYARQMPPTNPPSTQAAQSGVRQANITDELRVQLRTGLSNRFDAVQRDARLQVAIPLSNEIVELQPGADYRWTTNLRGGTPYVVVGLCDGDCKDIDIELIDSSGSVVASDMLPDNYPVVDYTPSETDRHTIRVLMQTCTLAPCFTAVRVLERAR